MLICDPGMMTKTDDDDGDELCPIQQQDMFVAKITMLDAIIRKIIYVITDLF